MSYDYDLLAVGSGPAGQRAAVQAAKLGKRAAIVERQIGIGGVCLESGTIPSKTFREAVLSVVATAEALTRQGLSRAVPRPAAPQLLARVREVVQHEMQVLEQQLRRNGVDIVGGQAAFVDPHTLTVTSDQGSRTVTAENIVLAVGTRAAPPPGLDSDGDMVLTSDEIGMLSRIPRTLTVVGAGVIGIEYASMFAALGATEVVLVDKRNRPLEFLDDEIVDELMHQMRKRNVAFRSGEAVAHIGRTDGAAPKVSISLESGKRIISDAVLFSVGRIGATDGLNLERAGLSADNRGRLTVNGEFRTAVPHIFAAGDVIGYPSLASTSSEQGRLAACYAIGIPAPPMASHFPIGIYAIPEVGMVGATEQELTKAKVPYEVGVARYREIARGQIIGDESGFFKMLFHREDRRLLGVHIIGTGATELLHIGQAVIGLGAGIDYFLETVFNYPTLAECYKVAALNAANKMMTG